MFQSIIELNAGNSQAFGQNVERPVLDADRMKVLLLDYVLERYEPDIIVSEFSFLQGYRKADLVFSHSGVLTAFEIKSPRDKLTRLSTQIADYGSVFSFCYLVTTVVHIEQARRSLSDKVGLMLVNDGGITELRSPKENRRLSKRSLSQSIPAAGLRQLPDSPTEEQDLDRHLLAARFKTADLTDALNRSMLNRYGTRYRRFLMDRGRRTTLTDLYNLQSR